MIAVKTLPTTEVDSIFYRIIPARYPQINLFERVSSAEDWDLLYEVESLTNPRLRDEAGDISLVAAEDRVYGEGSSWVMAAFTHPPVDGQGGRFNRDFGVYYCAAEETVAVAESSFRRAKFLRESRIDRAVQEMRVIRARLGPVALHDVRHLRDSVLYDPDDYSEPQRLGMALWNKKSFGVLYQSVRIEGECAGVMRAKALSHAVHWRYLRYHYEQGNIVRVEPLDGKSN